MNPTFPLEQGYLQHHIKATLPLFGQVLKTSQVTHPEAATPSAPSTRSSFCLTCILQGAVHGRRPLL